MYGFFFNYKTFSTFFLKKFCFLSLFLFKAPFSREKAPQKTHFLATQMPGNNQAPHAIFHSFSHHARERCCKDINKSVDIQIKNQYTKTHLFTNIIYIKKIFNNTRGDHADNTSHNSHYKHPNKKGCNIDIAQHPICHTEQSEESRFCVKLRFFTPVQDDKFANNSSIGPTAISLP